MISHETRSLRRFPPRIPTSVEPRLHPFLIENARTVPIMIDGRPWRALLTDARKKGVNIDLETEWMFKRDISAPSIEPQPMTLVIVRAADIVSKPKGERPTTEEIQIGSRKKGLVPISKETALHYLLQEGDKLQREEELFMDVGPLYDFDGNPCVLVIHREGNELCLATETAAPDEEWEPGDWFIFGLPAIPSTTQE